jgi:tRNA(fMet)-specific endonuclease VapC
VGYTVIRYLLDSDTFTLYLRHDIPVFTSVLRHIPDGIGLPVYVVEEFWDGWQPVIRKAKSPDEAAAAYQRLTDTLMELRNWPIVAPPPDSLRSYQQLKKAKLNVGASDLKIAAIALSIGATLVTGNTRDFSRVVGLKIEDWSARVKKTESQ